MRAAGHWLEGELHPRRPARPPFSAGVSLWSALLEAAAAFRGCWAAAQQPRKADPALRKDFSAAFRLDSPHRARHAPAMAKKQMPISKSREFAEKGNEIYSKA